MKVKNWLFGLITAVAMLFSSALYAADVSPPASDPAYDCVFCNQSVVIDPTDTLISVNVMPSPDGVGAGSVGTAMATDSVGCGGGVVNYMATCNHKATDNVTAHASRSFEVGWRS